jgi:hypothetical protein
MPRRPNDSSAGQVHNIDGHDIKAQTAFVAGLFRLAA